MIAPLLLQMQKRVCPAQKGIAGNAEHRDISIKHQRSLSPIGGHGWNPTNVNIFPLAAMGTVDA
jgi:hypothetical protein